MAVLERDTPTCDIERSDESDTLLFIPINDSLNMITSVQWGAAFRDWWELPAIRTMDIVGWCATSEFNIQHRIAYPECRDIIYEFRQDLRPCTLIFAVPHKLVQMACMWKSSWVSLQLLVCTIQCLMKWRLLLESTIEKRRCPSLKNIRLTLAAYSSKHRSNNPVTSSRISHHVES
jgi:hypothetical protein